MLDSYIIERIRREREQARQREAFHPLPLEAPRPPDRPRTREVDAPSDRGSVVVDFEIP